MRVVDEARVLVPAERHPLLRGLHDVLLVEEVDGVPERCLGDLRHEFGAQERSTAGLLPYAWTK